MKNSLLIFLLSFISSYSQTSTIDSLMKSLEKNNQDSLKVKSLITLSNALMEESEFDKALEFAEQAESLSQKIMYRNGMALSYNCLGNIYDYKGDFNKALEYHQKGLDIKTKMNDKKGMASSYGNMGNIYKEQSNYPKALEYYDKCYKISEATNDLRSMALALNNTGNVYILKAEYPKALDYHLKALKIREKNSDKKGIGYSYSNIGLIYDYQLNYKKAKEYYTLALKIREELDDRYGMANAYNSLGGVCEEEGDLLGALDYFEKSLKIREEIGDKYGLSVSLNNIGTIYEEQNKYTEALIYFNKALKIKEELEDKNGISTSYYNIGKLFLSLKKHNEAVKCFDKVVSISKEIGATDNIRYGYEGLAESYSALGNYKEAYKNHILFKELTDSIFNIENSKEIGDLKTNFEVEKKEAELKIKTQAEKEKLIAVSAERDKRQQVIIFSVIGVLIIVIVFSSFLYNRFVLTRKQHKIIEVQKKEVEVQKEVIEEKQKEVMDSIHYARRIQRALLASDSFLNSVLHNYFIYFNPKDVVSGDFYWATKSHGKFYLAIADSTGHGVPGAFMSLLNMSFLNEAINEKGLEKTNEILGHTRKRLIKALAEDGSEEGGKDGMDCSLMCFDFENLILEFSCANNPLLIIRDGEVIHTASDRMPVGRSPREAELFTLHKFPLMKNDLVYAFTDGYPDQFGGPKGKKYKYKQLEEKLLSMHLESVTDQKNSLKTEFETWKGNLEQVDDVLMFGIRI